MRHDNHWISKDYKQRMTVDDWKKILLNNDDTITFRGRIVPLVAKEIGFGIVEVQKDQTKL